MSISSSATTIGKSVKIRGEIVSNEDLVMDGDFEGTIHVANATLTLGPASRVRADIAGQDVVVHGRMEGDIQATGRVELRTGSMMQGDITAGSLQIEPNVAFRGKVEPLAHQAAVPAPAIAQAAAPQTMPERAPTPERNVLPERAAMPIRPAQYVPPTSYGPGAGGIRTAVVQPPPYVAPAFGQPGGSLPASSGSHRAAGQYSSALAAAAAAAAAANRKPYAPAGHDQADPEREPATPPAPTLVFNERKA